MRGRRSAWLGVAALAALLVLLAPAAAFGQGETLNVTKTEDDSDQPCLPTDCALRVALENAQDGDTVNVPAGVYVLELGELTVFQDVSVVGAGARQTIVTAGNDSKVLGVFNDVTASISGVMLTGGNGTGGQNPGQGGAVYVPGGSQLALNSSTVAGNTVAGSTPTTGHGGGVYSAGRLFLSNSTVSGNQASSNGGGIYQTGNELLLAVASSTISGNTAGPSGGGIYSAGLMAIGRSTIAGNSAQLGAGIYKAFGAASISDTIVSAGALEACGNFSTVTGTHNLSSDASCPFTSPGDLRNVDAALGPLTDNGGPTNTHALSALSPAIGAANPDPQQCTGTDQRGITRPQQGTCDVGAFEYQPPPPGGQQQPPPEEQELPPPEAGRTVNALPESGTVRVRLPGRRKYRRLSEGEQLPVGTRFDTRKGHVTLVAAANRTGGTATAEFWAGIFRLTQTKGSRPTTDLKLIEKLRCPKANRASIAAKRKKKRRLWGNGKGRFRTTGEYSSATVRGTEWLVEDRCASTLTRVVSGRVTVRDFVKRKRVIVRAKKRYVARKSVQSR